MLYEVKNVKIDVEHDIKHWTQFGKVEFPYCWGRCEYRGDEYIFIILENSWQTGELPSVADANFVCWVEFDDGKLINEVPSWANETDDDPYYWEIECALQSTIQVRYAILQLKNLSRKIFK